MSKVLRWLRLLKTCRSGFECRPWTFTSDMSSIAPVSLLQKTIQGCQTPWGQFSHSTGMFRWHVSISPFALGTPCTRDASCFIFGHCTGSVRVFNKHEMLSQWAATHEVSKCWGSSPASSIRLLQSWWSSTLSWQLNPLPRCLEGPWRRQRSWSLPPGNRTYIDCFPVWHPLGFPQSILYWPWFCFLKQKVSVERHGGDGGRRGQAEVFHWCALIYFIVLNLGETL